MNDYITIERDLYEDLLEKEAFLKCLNEALTKYKTGQWIYKEATRLYNLRNEIKENI